MVMLVLALTIRAAEILKEVKPFLEEGVGVHVIIKGLRQARDLVSSTDQTRDKLRLTIRRSRRSTRLP
jgi:chaperonin GroEL (HSP60 family)